VTALLSPAFWMAKDELAAAKNQERQESSAVELAGGKRILFLWLVIVAPQFV